MANPAHTALNIGYKLIAYEDTTSDPASNLLSGNRKPMVQLKRNTFAESAFSNDSAIF